jgi:four helix bundle protein
VNIAEGFLRCSPGDFRRFLDYSLASLGETERRLKNGIARKFFEDSACAPAFRLAKRATMAIIRLKQSQRRKGP